MRRPPSSLSPPSVKSEFTENDEYETISPYSVRLGADAPLLRIGAFVRVADTGKLYRHYTQWALDNLKSDQLVAFGVGSTLDWTNKEGKVVAIARHSINKGKWLVAVESEDKDTKRKAIGIFAAEGLEVLA